MVAELIAGQKPHAVDPNSIAGCTYCHPQIASVGMTEAQAKDAGHDIKVGRFPFIGNGKAIALGEPEGMVKTIFDAKKPEGTMQKLLDIKKIKSVEWKPQFELMDGLEQTYQWYCEDLD